MVSLINKYYAMLSGFSETPLPDAKALLSYVLKKDPLLVWRALSPEEEELMLYLIEKRKKGVPVAYLTGEKEFMSLPFFVNENTLIPRPDTEIIVETLIDMYKNKSPEILDLCSGTGCIGISLAHYISGSNVTLADVSEGALEISEKNISRHGLSQRVKTCLFDVLKDSITKKYDIIVSNPPYIESAVCKNLEVSRYEPNLALDGGGDGLKFYRAIIPKAFSALNPGGVLAFEIGYDQGLSVPNLMKTCFSEIFVKKDYGDNDRMVYAVKNK